MVHKRSPEASAKHFVMRSGYLDRNLGEIVNQTSEKKIMDYLDTIYYYADVSLATETLMGEVLRDSRGTGSFQLADKPIIKKKQLALS